MVTKTDQLIAMIVDIVSQDHESFQIIEKELSDWAAEKSLQVSEAEFRSALASAIQNGFIQAFKYQEERQEFQAVPWDDLESEYLYYLATKEGRATLQ